ncbi:MAG: glycoside hydrolase, partial [Ruminiclostridium sp.]|nr:glycoside hydrolase [Ruminiclostridium sp.]
MDMKQFENPSPLYRNAPFWSWNDRLNIDELKRQMDEMIDKGWGSFFMHSRVGLVTGYLSEEWMEAVNTCAAHAKETGAFIWLYDEDKWPSGFAGGIVPEKSEKYRSKALVLLKNNELTENDTILKEINTEDGRAYICYRADTLGDTGFNGASYVDLMNPETVREFLQCTHEQYKKQCGECFGKEIKGVFTDEPCYNIHNNYKAPVVPWSDYLPDFFMKLKGYDIRQHLEKLFYSTGDYRKIRFDFYDAATRLYIESFSMQ